jgi:lipopolysaccharide transport system ATP-binding protein
MAIDFRDVALGPLEGFTASAPDGAIIGIIGQANSGIGELLKIASGVLRPTAGQVSAPAAVVTVDHTLATQDAVERIQALTALDRLRRSGSTILLASHELPLLELVCDEVWWLDKGRLAAKGDPKETLARYRQHVADEVRKWGETVPSRLEPSYRHGDRRAEVVSIETLGSDGKTTTVWKSGEMVHVRAAVRFHKAVPQPVFGMMIRTRIGFEVYGTNTELEAANPGPQLPGDTATVLFSFRCDLCPHFYTITIASHDPDGTAHDWLDDAVAITVAGDRYTAGVANLRAKVAIE